MLDWGMEAATKGLFGDPDPNTEYIQQVNAIREQFQKQRMALQQQLQALTQQLARAQAECSAGQQSSCQMLGGLNSQKMTLTMDLSKLDSEETRILQDLENQQKRQGSSIKGQFAGPDQNANWTPMPAGGTQPIGG